MSNTILKNSSTIFAGIFLFLLHSVFSAFEEKPINLFYNPAVFEAGEEKNEIFTSYTELFDISELKYSVFAYSRIFSLDNKFGFSIQRFGGDIYSEEVRLLNFCRKFVKKLSMGVNIKEMRLEIESLNNDSVSGVDAGMQYEFHKNLRFGCAARNFNRPKIIDNLPIVWTAGISCNVFEGIIWAFDWEKEEGFEDNFCLGQKICLNEFLFLRAGYETETSRISGGFGLKIKPIQIDYNIFSHSVLGNTQIVSFIIRW